MKFKLRINESTSDSRAEGSKTKEIDHSSLNLNAVFGAKHEF